MNRPPATYQVTVRETALGSMRVSHGGNGGPHVFIVGPQECTHHLFAGDARDVAKALLATADEAEAAAADGP